MDEFEGAPLRTPKQIEQKIKKPMTGARFAWQALLSIVIPFGISYAGYFLATSGGEMGLGGAFVLYAIVPVFMMLAIYLSIFILAWMRLRYVKITPLWLALVFFWMLMTSGMPFIISQIIYGENEFAYYFAYELLFPNLAMLIIFIVFLFLVPKWEKSRIRGKVEKIAWVGAWGSAIGSMLYIHAPIGAAGNLLNRFIGAGTPASFLLDFLYRAGVVGVWTPVFLTIVFGLSLSVLLIIRHRQNADARLG